MIHIDKKLNNPPISVYTNKKFVALDGVTKVTKAEQETEKAITFFTDKTHYEGNEKITSKTFTFHAYKDPKLVEMLKAYFHGKCAYCESEIGHIAPEDIEHFRPKSSIDTGDEILKPGYYWQAADWQNLLVSCIDCNRKRKHKVPGQPKKINIGKLDQFPLLSGAIRVRKHTEDVKREEPYRLLIHPCIDNPEEHLTFDEQGLIHPRKDNKNLPSKMGKNSIYVYALQRQELVERRKCVMINFKFQVGHPKYLVSLQVTLSKDGSTVHSQKNLEQIDRICKHIKSLTSRTSPYLAMLREYISRIKHAGELENLIRLGINLEDLIKA